MKERTIRVGRPVPLIGVMCEPDKVDVSRPAVLIFNSGVMHHIGSCRLSVKLARSFAAKGVLSIRFDFSGIGDSAARRGVKPFSETAPLEAAEVMDYLQQKRGIKKFILYGLCSGADAAYETALVDDRVVAYSQIDAYCYKTPLFYYYFYSPKLFKLDRWVNLFRRLMKKKLSLKKPIDNSEEEKNERYLEAVSYIREFPPKNVVRAGLNSLINRGLFMNIIFTAGEDDYGYRNQYRDSFSDIDFGQHLELHYFDTATHIMSHPSHQRLVVEIITQWLVDVIKKMEKEKLEKVGSSDCVLLRQSEKLNECL